MTIISVCPYCRLGGVRAPKHAVGQAATCPNCRSSFTVTPTELPPGHPERRERQEVPAETAARPALPTEPSPVLPQQQPAVTPDQLGTDPGFVVGLVGLILVGVALAATPFPYGRYVMVSAAGLGLLAGGLGLLMADRRRLVPGIAAGLNGLAILVAVALPGVLGLDDWRSAPPPDEGWQVRAAALDGSNPVPAEWVDVSSAAWLREDVRIAVPSVTVAPVELIGPQNQRKRTKEKSLQVRVVVANAGVARRLSFPGWSVPPPPGKPGPQLTDSVGKALPPRKFEAGWRPQGVLSEPAGLFPGKSAEDLLIFEPPAAAPDKLRLELPAEVFGFAEPVRLLIPRSAIQYR